MSQISYTIFSDKNVVTGQVYIPMDKTIVRVIEGIADNLMGTRWRRTWINVIHRGRHMPAFYIDNTHHRRNPYGGNHK